MPVSARDTVGIAVDGVATPDLYRDNAFRRGGLPTDASPRELAEAGDGYAELRDPVLRLVHEWFWLWPNGPGPVPRAVAVHNRAVVAHYAAVEADPSDADGRPERWAAAYLCWHEVLAENACWDHLRDRACAIADPRAGAAEVSALRAVLPRALLTVHARLAVAAAPADPGAARAQMRAMRRSGFPARLADTALREAVDAHIARLRADMDRKPDDTAAHALAIADREDLAVLRTILGERHVLTAGAADELATRVRAHVVAQINATGGDTPARRAEAVRARLGQMEAAAALAVGTDARARIGRDLAVVVNNLVVAMCDEALEEAEEHPAEGHALHERLLRDTRAHVRRVGRLDPAAVDRLRDDVVGTSLVLLFKYATATRDLPATLAALRRVQDQATGAELRVELAEAIDALEGVASPPSVPNGPCSSTGRSCAARAAGWLLIGAALTTAVATGLAFHTPLIPLAALAGVAALTGLRAARRRARRGAVAPGARERGYRIRR